MWVWRRAAAHTAVDLFAKLGNWLADVSSPCKEMSKTAMTSAAELAGNGFHTSLPSDCLTASGSLPPFTWLC
ncbi:hypothetical protein T265_00112 [Opisthorchis viverrini]|uniref:Uncharacterized protein n=1 Tax=Opisthorchis viverrini TaxID=6198 RepID=A0A075A4H0_OPIVI|nr:hypothetical protein T265_00112 [Opisthorchis viverrini]KER34261.1 hypothetical protein T265_00112 [Opisthorchis viverrini]